VVGYHQQDVQEFLMGLLQVLNIQNRQSTATSKLLIEVNLSLSVKENWSKFR
jgi:hypothetical protein